MTGPVLALVITGAPLARRTTEALDAAADRGWHPYVVATAAALDWFDPASVGARDVQLLTDHRRPDKAERQQPPPGGFDWAWPLDRLALVDQSPR